MSRLDSWPVLRDFLGAGRRVEDEERDIFPLSFADWSSFFTYQGNAYGIGFSQTLTGKSEPIEGNFGGVVGGAVKGNAVVFACMGMRLRVFSQARFQFRQIRMGQPGDLFGTPELGILENPFGGSSTTGDLLAHCIQDVDGAGNSFTVRRGNILRRLRPDWTSILLTAPEGDPDAEVAGYMYYPGGKNSGRDSIPFAVEDVAHFAPIPDPIATFRGMSWMTPLLREIQADTAMTDHRQKFMDNGATPNLIVKFPPEVTREQYNEWKKAIKGTSEGRQNAYKTLFLAGGADAQAVGTNFRQLDFKVVQGAGETRIAAAAGVPPVIVGLSEGLQAATYSNYSQAKRAFADTTIAHLWQNMCGSMARIINVPARSELWYDDSGMPFLREDAKDAAEISQIQAVTLRQLIEAGWEADQVVKAVMAGDMSLLAGHHTGLFSIQLQAPGSLKMPEGEVPGEHPVAGPAGAPPEKTPGGKLPNGAAMPNGNAPDKAGVGS